MRTDQKAVGEGEVLVAAIKYLLTRKAEPKTVSVASGNGINVRSIEQDVKDCLQSESRESLNFKRSGPDIIAVSNKECWIVECNGAGKGKAQTQRNNFDRALASVVSYWS